ncbi:hypothetical protein PV08_06716 [Exophiala spinifera]|uniref:Uncharacterized protein n=1 Tax=Exophiala spinifera TaxID=91928 RepID=A0A0D2B5H1_9EURO|nr:uncharacterized protein PV08_06716 [Exophiala spinifera]KIW13935.1 hypothetical protein PV08_06716 [Exophiala spinifera]
MHGLTLLIYLSFGICFKSIAANSDQVLLGTGKDSSILNVGGTLTRTNPTGLRVWQFDDIKTTDAFGNISTPYNGLIFDGFYAFDPSDAGLKGIIWPGDTNCAVSKPNALYGTRDNFKLLNSRTLGDKHIPSGSERKPSFRHTHDKGTFTVHGLKIKPLDLPLGFVTVHLQGTRPDATLAWEVDFPAGYHDVLDVRLQEFSGRVWHGLERLEIWADFHYNGLDMDWEFCVDDIDVEME